MNSEDISGEVALLSKKISDHAEEIYKTWKNCGLAPAEIFNCYKELKNDLFETHLKTASDDQASAEGLQKLVSSFVRKDKARNQTGRDKIVSEKSEVLSSNPQSIIIANTRADIAEAVTATNLRKQSQVIPYECTENACVAKTKQSSYQNYGKQPSNSDAVNFEIRRTSDTLPIDYLKETFFNSNFRGELDIRIKKDIPKTETKIKISLNNKEFFQGNLSLKRNDGVISKFYNDSDITLNMKENLSTSDDEYSRVNSNNCSEPSLYSNSYNIARQDSECGSDTNKSHYFESNKSKNLTEGNAMEIFSAAPAPMLAPTKLRPTRFKHVDNANVQDKQSNFT